MLTDDGEFKCNWTRRDQMTDHMVTDKLQLKAIPMANEQVKLDKVAATFVKIRDKRTELKKAYEVEDQKLKDQIAAINGFFLATLTELGVESARTKYGTVYKSIDVKPSCDDWNAFGDWIIENNAIEALERRVKKSFITDYMAENKDELPPGISVVREFVIKVLRK